jgi:hypothetical protein
VPRVHALLDCDGRGDRARGLAREEIIAGHGAICSLERARLA